MQIATHGSFILAWCLTITLYASLNVGDWRSFISNWFEGWRLVGDMNCLFSTSLSRIMRAAPFYEVGGSASSMVDLSWPYPSWCHFSHGDIMTRTANGWQGCILLHRSVCMMHSTHLYGSPTVHSLRNYATHTKKESHWFGTQKQARPLDQQSYFSQNLCQEIWRTMQIFKQCVFVLPSLVACPCITLA